jgi:hypothetical protein
MKSFEVCLKQCIDRKGYEWSEPYRNKDKMNRILTFQSDEDPIAILL